MTNKRQALRDAFNKKLEREQAIRMEAIREDVARRHRMHERYTEAELRRLVYGSRYVPGKNG